ncbi:hypothetical protein AWZ03_005315 [Drosophila navojoa]|uniref:Uncharacterized protein n=1 Tax=Drosophila navojoa TaxID=7232 RepID=A0A484BJY8_DRONA|nr:hypothetical protein AWZ03_005315 [Drosophila navojoa]
MLRRIARIAATNEQQIAIIERSNTAHKSIIQLVRNVALATRQGKSKAKARQGDQPASQPASRASSSYSYSYNYSNGYDVEELELGGQGWRGWQRPFEGAIS